MQPGVGCSTVIDGSPTWNWSRVRAGGVERGELDERQAAAPVVVPMTRRELCRHDL